MGVSKCHVNFCCGGLAALPLCTFWLAWCYSTTPAYSRGLPRCVHSEVLSVVEIHLLFYQLQFQVSPREGKSWLQSLLVEGFCFSFPDVYDITHFKTAKYVWVFHA